MSSPALTVSTPSPLATQGESFLKFQLAPKVLALFPAKVVQEATILPSKRVTALPNMPPCLIGLMHRRSRVIWVASLMRLMGLMVPERSMQQYALVIVQVGTSPLALQVETIEGIITISPEAIVPPPAQVNPAIVAYVKGCVTQGEETLLVLDAEAILQSSALQPDV
jgi:positive phototaxis protein PixI